MVIFLAEVTQHIPDPGAHLLRYDGWYSNKSRGQRAPRTPSAAPAGTPAPSPTARAARKGWAALLKQVYEVDPLACPKCGGPMKVIAFLERHQTGVIEQILRHCGLWPSHPLGTLRPPPSQTWPEATSRLGMRERLDMVGGSFAVESAAGRGTTVHARVPFPARPRPVPATKRRASPVTQLP